MKKAFLIVDMTITLFAAIMGAVANNVVLNDAFQKKLGFLYENEKHTLLFCIPLYFGQIMFNLSAILAAVRVIPTPEKGVKVAGAMLITMNALMIIFSVTVLIVSIGIAKSQDPETAALIYKLLTLRI